MHFSCMSTLIYVLKKRMSKLKCIQKKFSKLFIFNEIQILNGNINVRILNHRFMNNFVLNFSLFKTPNLRK